MMRIHEISQDDSPEAAQGRIIVGVDGSPSSVAALREARRFAELEGRGIDAVICWEAPPVYRGLDPLAFDDFREGAKRTLADAVEKAYGTELPEDLTLATIAAAPRRALTALSENATMLVLGTRGHGPFTGFFLGSVSAGCIAHACCPVLIVHSDEDLTAKNAA